MGCNQVCLPKSIRNCRLDNCTMFAGSWTKADVIAAAKKACAHEFIKDLADGYHTRVGERGIRISGGQVSCKKRRCLYMCKGIICMSVCAATETCYYKSIFAQAQDIVSR